MSYFNIFIFLLLLIVIVLLCHNPIHKDTFALTDLVPSTKYNILIVSGGTVHNRPFAEFSQKINRMYANKHDYQFHFVNLDETYFYKDYDPQWQKIGILSKYFNPQYDYIMWIDDDAIFLNHELTLNPIFSISNSSDVILCRDIIKVSSVNSGVMIFKTTEYSYNLLNSLHEIGKDYKNKPYHEQSMLEHIIDNEFGFSSLREFFDGRYSKSLEIGYPVKSEHFCIFGPNTFNGNGNFILHMAGASSDERTQKFKDLYNKFQKNENIMKPGLSFPWLQDNIKIIPRYIPPRSSSYNQKIPQVIYQTFNTNVVSHDMYDAITSWIIYNPEYAYKFYDDIDCLNFLKTHFNQDVVDAYNSLIPGAFKADLWRYCMLYVEGGVYCDIKSICKMPLNKSIHPEDDCILTIDRAPRDIYNAFFCSIPNNPLLKLTIESCVDMIKNKSYGVNMLDITGPARFGDITYKFFGMNRESQELQVGAHHRHGLNFRLFRHSPVHNRQIVNDKDKHIITTRYQCYSGDENKFLEMTTGKHHYSKYWNDKKVYV